MNKKIIIEYYLVVFHIDLVDYYTFWYTDEMDKFLLGNDQQIVSFVSKAEADTFIQNNSYKINDQILCVTLEPITKMNSRNINCNSILTEWNILSDFSKTIDSDFLGDHNEIEIQNIYNKLFYGCNLPSFKKDSEDYIPVWEDNEIAIINKVINNGIAILKRELHRKAVI